MTERYNLPELLDTLRSCAEDGHGWTLDLEEIELLLEAVDGSQESEESEGREG